MYNVGAWGLQCRGMGPTMYNVGACRRGVLNVQCRGGGATMYIVGAWGPQCTMQGCFRIYITYDSVRDMKLNC